METPAFALAALLLAIPTTQPPESVGDDPRVVDALNLLDVWFDAQQQYGNIPGISAAVVYDQELLWSRGFGYADVERGIEATPKTMYSICSISKLFTSIGVMQLRDLGHLRLDDPVFGAVVNGEARAYPWRQMANHELANDVIQGRPVAVVF